MTLSFATNNRDSVPTLGYVVRWLGVGRFPCLRCSIFTTECDAMSVILRPTGSSFDPTSPTSPSVPRYVDRLRRDRPWRGHAVGTTLCTTQRWTRRLPRPATPARPRSGLYISESHSFVALDALRSLRSAGSDVFIQGNLALLRIERWATPLSAKRRLRRTASILSTPTRRCNVTETMTHCIERCPRAPRGASRPRCQSTDRFASASAAESAASNAAGTV